MNKLEFLKALESAISVLDNVEQADILSEYTQHINMKVESGMTEEAAVADFGPINQLAAEILAAYHVRPDYAPAAPVAPVQAPQKEGLVKGLKTSIVGHKTELTPEEKAEKAERKAARAERRDERRKRNSERVAGAGRVAGAAAGATGRGIKGLIFWIWIVIVACVTLFIIGCGLSALFGFGASLVLMVQGYPLIGVTLATLGTVAVLGAPSYALVRWIYESIRNRKEAIHA